MEIESSAAEIEWESPSPAPFEAEETILDIEASVPPGPAPRRKPLPPIFWILVALLAVLLVVGIGSLAYFVTLTSGERTSGATPWDQLDENAITSGLAVWSLSDIALEQLYQQAMAGNDLETAAAATITTPDLPPAQRLGWLTVLARRYALAGQRDRALAFYRVAGDITLLETQLSDRQRSDALVEIARGFAELGETDSARHFLLEAETLVQNSPNLSVSARREILEAAAKVFETMNDFAQAQAARSLPALAAAAPQTPLPDPFDVLGSTIDYTPDIVVAQETRREIAQTFVDTWLNQGGAVPRGTLANLQSALIDEDVARSVFYEQRLSDADLGNDERLRVLWDQIRWLTLKYRAATGLFGVDLVPNWTAEAPAIRTSLSGAYTSLTDTALDFLSGLPEDERPAARHALYRRLLAAARLGLYPDADQTFLANALNDALADWDNPDGSAPAARVGRGGAVSFTLQAEP